MVPEGGVKLHVLERTLVVPGDLPAVFDFFKDPHNLSELTPPWLNFRVRATTDRVVREGTRIEYRIGWFGVPMRWESVIEWYEEGRQFADRMVAGPYAHWFHIHSFTEVPGGVVVDDRVEYAMPLGWAGEVAHVVMMRHQLDAIFEFRTRALVSRFGAMR